MAYARERKQMGHAIVDYPDVKRMLLTMRALTGAARAICYATGVALDRAHRGKTDAARKAGNERASLLTPVAKAFSTDIGIEVASLGVQVHGGMGFIEETGAAQHYRDARIAAIYEGTNGIQAIDLVTRKLPLDGGKAVAALSRRIARARVERCKASNAPAFGETAARLGEADRQSRARDAMAAGAKIVRHGARRRHALLAAVRQCRRRLHAGRTGAGRRYARATAPRAPRWRGSSPRTSRCRHPASNAASPKAPTASPKPKPRWRSSKCRIWLLSATTVRSALSG